MDDWAASENEGREGGGKPSEKLISTISRGKRGERKWGRQL